MSADFISFALAVPSSMRQGLMALAEHEAEYNGNVYLTCHVDEVIELVGEELGPRFALSPNFAVFVAIDRFGVDRRLLHGRAARYVANEELAEFRDQWTVLKTLPELVERAAAAIARGQDAEAEIQAGIAAIDGAIDAACRSALDLVLLSLPT